MMVFLLLPMMDYISPVVSDDGSPVVADDGSYFSCGPMMVLPVVVDNGLYLSRGLRL